eukprot:1153090-Pelagomonas_calceolata.AAC.1
MPICSLERPRGVSGPFGSEGSSLFTGPLSRPLGLCGSEDGSSKLALLVFPVLLEFYETHKLHGCDSNCMDGRLHSLSASLLKPRHSALWTVGIRCGCLFHQTHLWVPLGQGTVKEVSEARDRRADIQIAVRDNERELAKYKLLLSLYRTPCPSTGFYSFNLATLYMYKYAATWVSSSLLLGQSCFKVTDCVRCWTSRGIRVPVVLVGAMAEILANENVRTDIQSRIDRLVSSNSNVAFLNFMRTFRLQ